MPIAVHFVPESMTHTVFAEILRRLNAAGLGAPKGRTLHVCYGQDERLEVFDIWDSKEDLDRFGEKLHPILEDLKLKLMSVEISEAISLSNETGSIDMLRAPAGV